MAFWMPLQKKTHFGDASKLYPPPTVFFAHKLMYVVGKNHLHSAEINMEFEKNDFQEESFVRFPASIFVFSGGVPTRRKKKSSSPGPSKRQIRHRSLLTGWPLTRVTTGPSWYYSKKLDSSWIFLRERAFQKMQMLFLKGHGLLLFESFCLFSCHSGDV